MSSDELISRAMLLWIVHSPVHLLDHIVKDFKRYESPEMLTSSLCERYNVRIKRHTTDH